MSPTKSFIYSIGHGNKPIEQFLQELSKHQINYVLDVRSKPYSKWNPQFNQEALQATLTEHHIKYAFFGHELGGRPDDETCYDEDGKVLYDVIKTKDFFKDGLNRLIKADSKSIPVAVLCSESKPEECHRSKLIGRELLKSGISMNHIISSSQLRTQEQVMRPLFKGGGGLDLFGERPLTSRKVY